MSNQSTLGRNGNRTKLSQIIHSMKQHFKNNKRLKFILIASGIFVSFICVGILKEKIMRGCYDNVDWKNCPEHSRFKFAITIVALQMLCAFIFMKALDLIKADKKDSTHMSCYIFASLANMLAMITSTMALRWISYPMEVIFRSTKPIAIMLAGLFVCKQYSIQKYLFVLMIVVGVVVFKLFEYKEDKSENDVKSINTTKWEQLIGMGLLIFSLCMDGALGVIQDRIRKVYSPTPRQMLLSMSACISTFTVILITINGELLQVFEFARRYPNVIWHLIALSIAGAIGQIFIFTMVLWFGPLTTSITSTVRKFFSIIFSILFFQNPSTPIQWIGAVLVFSALIADTVFGKRKHKVTNKEELDENVKHNVSECEIIKISDNQDIVSDDSANDCDITTLNID